jgi:hypothetical protein
MMTVEIAGKLPQSFKAAEGFHVPNDTILAARADSLLLESQSNACRVYNR